MEVWFITLVSKSNALSIFFLLDKHIFVNNHLQNLVAFWHSVNIKIIRERDRDREIASLHYTICKWHIKKAWLSVFQYFDFSIGYSGTTCQTKTTLCSTLNCESNAQCNEEIGCYCPEGKILTEYKACKCL